MYSTHFITRKFDRIYARNIAYKGCMFLVAIVFSVQQVSEAQQSTEEDPNAAVILTYNVADLVMNAPDYNYTDSNPNSIRIGGGMVN